MQYNYTDNYKVHMGTLLDMVSQPYECDTPNCTGEKEVITPEGYVCNFCAARMPTETREAGF